MGKVYTANGEKMNVQQILAELQGTTVTKEPLRKSLTSDLSKSIKNDQMRLAHAVLDCYKNVDGATPEGERARKLMDNIMTKYQKSVGTPSAEDQAMYHSFICDITRGSEE
jgi:hypothetical protein